MSDDLDFDLETESAVPDSGPEAEPAAPVVVIQYRNRGIPPYLLFPITLVLSLGMFAGYHYAFVSPKQRELRDRALAEAAALASLTRVAEESKAGVSEAGAEASSRPRSPDLGGVALSLDGQPLPAGFSLPVPPPGLKEPGATRVAAKPVDAADVDASIWDELNEGAAGTAEAAAPNPGAPQRKQPTPPPAIGFARPGEPPIVEPPSEVAMGSGPASPGDVVKPPDKPEPAVSLPPVESPVAKPTPSREEMMQSLEAEAAAKRAALADQLRLKDEARARVEIEAQDRVESDRERFRDELKRILAANGPDAGQDIDDLCNEFGRNYGGDLKAQVLDALSRYHGRITRENEIRMLRSFGVPEPGILDYLANNLHRSINSRNGPRSPDAVRVLAAKQLLRSKVNSSSDAPALAPPSGPSRVRQPRAARNTVAGPAR